MIIAGLRVGRSHALSRKHTSHAFAMRSSTRYVQSGLLIILLLLLLAEVVQPPSRRTSRGLSARRDWRSSRASSNAATDSHEGGHAVAGVVDPHSEHAAESGDFDAETTLEDDGGEAEVDGNMLAMTGVAVGAGGAAAMCARVLGTVGPAADEVEKPPCPLPEGPLRAGFEGPDGSMPITRDYCQPHQRESAVVRDWSESHIDSYCKGVLSKKSPGPYGVVEDERMKSILRTLPGLAGSEGIVYGPEDPWIECLALDVGAAAVTKISTGRIRSEYPRIASKSAETAANDALAAGTGAGADWAVLGPPLSAAGLGRYDDVLNPEGDKEAVLRAWCMLKPGGYLLIAAALRCAADGYIEFNAHRVYGWTRLSHITEGFTLHAAGFRCAWLETGSISVVVLRKPENGERPPSLITEDEFIAANVRAKKAPG